MIDVWYNTIRGREQKLVKSIQEGKTLMKRLRSLGKEDIVMYVRHDDSSGNRQYYFKGDKIIFDKDDY